MKVNAILAAVCAAWACVANATDMERKMKVVKSFTTALGARGDVVCDKPGGWSFDVSCAVDDGRDAVTVRLTSPTEAMPPHFGVFLVSSGAGVQNVWTCDPSVNGDGCHLWPKLWSPWHLSSSALACDTPIAVGFNSTGAAPVAMACSEAFEPTKWLLYADDNTCEMTARFEFFEKPVRAMKSYSATVLLDRRGRGFADAVRDCTDWIVKANGFEPAKPPAAAFDPVYSTWYAYLQDVSAAQLEEEARMAAALGMKTMILDDGWQKVDSASFYSATGDWMPVPSRFPDIKAHVAKVHEAGLKYMVWLAVPYVGDESKAWAQFKDKLLSKSGDRHPGMTGVLDPRFPEVREYLIQTYERAVGEWGFDGLKLDFIDQFAVKGTDPAQAQNYAGRDYRSVPEAVDRLLKDVRARLQRIRPDVMIEFRQHYMGPAILQYGDMMRAADCPADPCANRRRVCDLRLTSGAMAVHSDMIVWSPDETPEGAALPILNAIFSTVQYSVRLAQVPKAHGEVIRHWLRFSQDHREALLKGAFRPRHPENGYTSIEGESATERVVAVYSDEVCASTGSADRDVYVINATGKAGLALRLAAPCEKAEVYDTFGRLVATAALPAGLQDVAVPASGYVKLAGRRLAHRADESEAARAKIEAAVAESDRAIDAAQARLKDRASLADYAHLVARSNGDGRSSGRGEIGELVVEP